MSTEKSCSIMLSPSCLVWKLLNLGSYFSFLLLAFSLCSGNLESPFALWQWLWTLLIWFFFILYVSLSVWLCVLKTSKIYFYYCMYKGRTIDSPPHLMSSLFSENGWGFRWLLDLLCYRLLHDMLDVPFSSTPFWKEEGFFHLFDLNEELNWHWGVDLSYFLSLDIFLFWIMLVVDDWKVVVVVKSNPCWKLCM